MNITIGKDLILTAKDKIEYLEENYPDALLADGFDDAIIGIAEKCGSSDVILYDKGQCIKIMESRDGMTEEEAIDFYYYNVVGAYMGEYTPCFVEVL